MCAHIKKRSRFHIKVYIYNYLTHHIAPMILGDILQVGGERGHDGLLDEHRVVDRVKYGDQQPVTCLVFTERYRVLLHYFQYRLKKSRCLDQIDIYARLQNMAPGYDVSRKISEREQARWPLDGQH